MSKVLLDTNAYSNLLRGNPEVLDHISNATDVFISVIVLGELFSGFKGGKSEKKNREILDNFLSKTSVGVLEVSKYTSEIFADVKHSLRSKGQPIPINDVWIAAHTMETGSKLLTFDNHFQAVDGLRVEYLEDN